MYKKKPLFVTFEGIEGSGKSYLSKKLYLFLKNKKLPVILTREPGGTLSAEKIRKLLLSGTKDKFSKTTDTLLYLAARNEHFNKVIKPNLSKNKIILCDRFVDSTFAYQVYAKGVNIKLVEAVHKHILGKFKPDLTFILKVNINKSKDRLKKRKIINRYDKFSKQFYIKAQNAFIKIAKREKKRCLIIDNSLDSSKTEKIILNKFIEILNK